MRTLKSHAASLLGLGMLLACLSGIAAPAEAGGHLYIADIFYPTFDDGVIYRMNTETLELNTVLTPGGGLRGIALDLVHDKIYWTDVTRRQIGRAEIDGTNPTAIITTGLSWPMDIDTHPTVDRIGWGDQSLEQIGLAHLDGTGAAPLLSTPFGSGIAFDRVANKIYWTTALADGVSGEIRRANLDGTSQQVVVSGLGKPARIVLDQVDGKIYWTDYVQDVVRRANLDGTQPQTLWAAGANLNPDGITLDLMDGKVYWAQEYAADRDKIMRMNLDGTQPEQVVVGNFGLISDLEFLTGLDDVEDLPSAAGSVIASGPNPFHDVSTIRLVPRQRLAARLDVFGIDGRRIATLLDATLAGPTEIRWNGTDESGRALPGGIYFYRLRGDGMTWTAKTILTR